MDHEESYSTPAVAEKTRDYVLGYSEIEAERLRMQAQLLRGWTDRFFRAAGLAELGAGPMRILDAGCGLGDVSMLAAEIAGPEATVLGIDRDAASLEKARQRVAQAGLDNRISFQQTDVTEFEATEKFDAVVGRLILLYQRNAGASLRHLAQQVKPGGLMVFHELDFGAVPRMGTVGPLWDWAYTLVGEGFRSGGADPSFGLKLTPAFRDAGLGWPKLLAETTMGGEPGSFLYWWIPATIKSILPLIEKAGLATADEVKIETLAERLEEEGTRLGTQIIGPTQFGAWVRVAG